MREASTQHKQARDGGAQYSGASTLTPSTSVQSNSINRAKKTLSFFHKETRKCSNHHFTTWFNFTPRSGVKTYQSTQSTIYPEERGKCTCDRPLPKNGVKAQELLGDALVIKRLSEREWEAVGRERLEVGQGGGPGAFGRAVLAVKRARALGGAAAAAPADKRSRALVPASRSTA